MNILITGATGFIGRHLLNELILQKCEITVVTRNKENAKSFSWHKKVSYIECDLHINPYVIFENDYMPDVIIHLAWSGLPNYNEFFHINFLSLKTTLLQELLPQ